MATVTDELFYALCEQWSDIQEHLPTFAALVHALDATTVLELGTRGGVSTVAWLWALGHTGGRLVAVDLSPPPPEFAALPDEAFCFIQGDDMDTAVQHRLHNEGPFDIVFIDTSHEYEHTLRELEVYVPMVRPGGLVLGHDTESFPEGVAKAFDDWCAVPTARRWFNDARCNGLAMIRV